jgi:hypothetical protein
MPLFEITIGVKATGKIFLPVPRHLAIGRLLTHIKSDVADYGVFLVLLRLASVLREPTGYYESRIKKDRQGDDFFVTDSGVVYGPWLEGTSSRNQISRFKGYRTFQQTKRQLDQLKVRLAQPSVNRFVSEMNS